MDKKKIFFLIFITLLCFILLYTFFNTNHIHVFIDNNSTHNNEIETFMCSSEQQNKESCVEINQPVCALVQVQCIRAPCDPVKQTFENSCKACSNPLVISYSHGSC